MRKSGAVTNWKPAGAKDEILFLPQQTEWGDKEVHGGIPICWPWFGKASREGLPKHGLKDLETRRALTLTATGNDAWFAWNPGVKNTPLCGTLGPDEWKGFFCVEPYDAKPHRLAPGESYTRTLEIK